MSEYSIEEAEIEAAIKRADAAILNFNRGGEYDAISRLFEHIKRLRELKMSWNKISEVLAIKINAEKLRSVFSRVDADTSRNAFAIKKKNVGDLVETNTKRNKVQKPVERVSDKNRLVFDSEKAQAMRTKVEQVLAMDNVASEVAKPDNQKTFEEKIASYQDNISHDTPRFQKPISQASKNLSDILGV